MTLHQCLKGARRTKRFGVKHRLPRMSTKSGTIVRLDLDTAPKNRIQQNEKLRKLVLKVVQISWHIFLVEVITFKNMLLFGKRWSSARSSGVRYHLFRNKLDFTMSEIFDRRARRSKFGKKKERPQD